MRALALPLALIAVPASAQDEEAPRRTRVAIGPQLVPNFPGARTVVVRPYIDVSRARGDTPFRFEAPDESTGFAIVNSGGFSFGPAIGFEGQRRAQDVGVAVPKVGFTFEAGGFAQYFLSPSIRARAEARYGIGGHRGLVGNVGADYVARKGDDWLISVGPRVTLANRRYQDAYFGVTPDTTARTGLATFRPKSGLVAVGATVGTLYQFSPKWGVVGYAKYDRLVDDAARSPIVRGYGNRNQWSGGLALSYTFR